MLNLSLVLLVLLLIIDFTVAEIRNRDVLDEHEVSYTTRQQIVSMSKAGITHDKIVNHLKRYHLKDKDDVALRDIVLAAHLEQGANLPKGLQQHKASKKKRSKEHRTATKPKRRRHRHD